MGSQQPAAHFMSGGSILGRSKRNSAGEIRGPSKPLFILSLFGVCFPLNPRVKTGIHPMDLYFKSIDISHSSPNFVILPVLTGIGFRSHGFVVFLNTHPLALARMTNRRNPWTYPKFFACIGQSHIQT
jgi:hypothetical protein